MNFAYVASYVRNAIFGNVATTVKLEGLDVNVLVRLDEDYRKTLSILNTLQIPSPLGYNVFLSDIAKIEYGYGPLVIERINKRRVVKVEADYYNRALSEVINDIQNVIKSIQIPPGIDIKISGSFERQREAFGQLFLALILELF